MGSEEKEDKADRDEKPQHRDGSLQAYIMSVVQNTQVPVYAEVLPSMQQGRNLTPEDGESEFRPLSITMISEGQNDQRGALDPSSAGTQNVSELRSSPFRMASALSSGDIQENATNASPSPSHSLGTKDSPSDSTQAAVPEDVVQQNLQRSASEQVTETGADARSAALFDPSAVIEKISNSSDSTLQNVQGPVGQTHNTFQGVSGGKPLSEKTVNEATAHEVGTPKEITNKGSDASTGVLSSVTLGTTQSSSDHQQRSGQGEASTTHDQNQPIGSTGSNTSNQPIHATTPFHVPLIEDSKLVSPGVNADAATVEAQTRAANVPDASVIHPAINTARLIQNMHDSELRVGIKSAEFGNISISASAGRDILSAQISLEHSDLAKEITANLPEIRAALGGGHLDVRVVTGQQMGAHTDTGANQSGSNGSQAHTQREAPFYMASTKTNVIEDNLVRETAAVPVAMGLSRVDVRI